MIGLIRSVVRRGAVAVAAAVVLATPWWGPRALRPLVFFRVRSVEVRGARYVAPSDIVRRLRVDTTVSLWDGLGPLAARVVAIPGIRAAEVSRRLPGTLVVSVTEAVPVALVPARGGMQPYDARGVPLAFDPTRVDLDLPVVTRADRRVLRLLDDVRLRAPALFAHISAVRIETGGDVVIETPAFSVRAGPDADAARIAQAVPVAADLARRRIPVLELDVRFRDQVVARRS
jgi:cell division septal protein FtsQ